MDYQSSASLRSALEGQDILISVLGKVALSSQTLLISAAVAAGVSRIIPSEFGSDLRNHMVRQFPTYQPKIAVEEKLEQHRTDSGVSYTLIFTNVLLDWGLVDGFVMDPRSRVVKLYDGGKNLFSTTTLATVGRAVVAVVDNCHLTSNRAVYIQDIATTQAELVEMAQEATANDGGKDWTIEAIDTAELEAESWSGFKQGLFTPKVFFGFAARAAFASGYGGHFQILDNELLGIRQMQREDLREFVHRVVRRVD